MEGFRRFWNEGVSVGGGGGERGYRRVRKRALKSTRKQKELEVSVNILIEEGLPNDPEILSISEMLRLNAPLAMKSALEGLKDSEYKTRDTAINDVGGYETIELSVLLCNDEFIRKLKKSGGTRIMPLMFFQCPSISQNLKYQCLCWVTS